jgi:predicted RNase H-like HicB family nuclease
MAGEVYTVRVHHEPGEELWAEVLELPGCFAAGADMEELREALSEAISLYLSEPGDVKHVELEDEPGSVTEHRMLARTVTAASGHPAAPPPNAAQDTPKKSTTPSTSPSQTSRNG